MDFFKKQQKKFDFIILSGGIFAMWKILLQIRYY